MEFIEDLTYITNLKEDGKYVSTVKEYPMLSGIGSTVEKALENLNKLLEKEIKKGEI